MEALDLKAQVICRRHGNVAHRINARVINKNGHKSPLFWKPKISMTCHADHLVPTEGEKIARTDG